MKIPKHHNRKRHIRLVRQLRAPLWWWDIETTAGGITYANAYMQANAFLADVVGPTALKGLIDEFDKHTGSL